MLTLNLETDPLAVTVEFSADAFRVALEDGRELSMPLAPFKFFFEEISVRASSLFWR